MCSIISISLQTIYVLIIQNIVQFESKKIVGKSNPK